MVTDACAVAIEIDGRQRYLFETDKLREMLGASRILARTVGEAQRHFDETKGLHLFSPVSGELRAWAVLNRREELLNAAWSLKQWLDEHGLEHTISYYETGAAAFLDECDGSETEAGPLAHVHEKIGRRVRRRKDAKGGPDATPTCSLFASCRLHGLDSANVWRPGEDKNGETRRELVGFRARTKLKTWEEDKKPKTQAGTRTSFYHKLLLDPIWERIATFLGEVDDSAKERLRRAITFTDLADRLDDPERREDQYIAFICADGDATGRLLSRLNWNAPAWGDEKRPWERNRDFAFALDKAVRDALADATASVVVPNREAAERLIGKREGKREKERQVFLPVLPQLRGGEDIWLVAARDWALKLATEFARCFERYASNGILRQAIEVAELDDRFTISLGIVFAKAGYPAHASIEAAEWLLRSAKSLRKGITWGRHDEGARQGCLDWHWVESSLSETVEEARERGWSYADDRLTMLLTTRPWTLGQTESFIEAHEQFAELPRRKRQQLETLLRLGYELSTLAWESWWKRLRAEEQDCLTSANESLGRWQLPSLPANPWLDLGENVFATPLLDLVALDDVFGRQETEAEMPSEEEEAEEEEAGAAA